MRFEYWWMWLIAIPVVALVIWVARRGARTVPRRQHRLAVGLRIVGVVLLVAALAGPILLRPIDDRSVLFLLDRSDSIGQSQRDAQERFLADAVDGVAPDHRWSVAVFGATTRVDRALGPGSALGEVLTEVDASATDLAGALTAGAALLPTEGSRRIVVLTDAVETGGDARVAAARLRDAGVAVDVVTLASERSADILVDSVRLPNPVRAGERVEAEVVLRSNTAGSVTLTVGSGEDEPPQQFDLSVEAGVVRVPVELMAGEQGALTVEAAVRADFDTRPENNAAVGVSTILGPASVLVVEGVPGEASELSAALEAGGLAIARTSTLPDAATLLEHDAVVLVDVDRPAGDAGQELAAFVEDLGRGLVVVGGEQAFGLGDYQDTPLDSVLPVSSNPDDLIRRQPVAEVLVLDTSGSMADCHCDDGVDGGQLGFPKTDIAAAGAELAIDALADSDRVGVLAFSSGTDWVLPLGEKPESAAVQEALGTLLAAGDTEIANALEEALAELEDEPEQLRHIVLFTDGWDPNDANLLPIARKIADAGVTLSVLATGEGPGATLRRMAQVGGGRYYPGEDLAAVPEVFVEETLTVARNLAVEGAFVPALGRTHPATEALSSAPPLLGYVLTKAKGSASVALQIGEGDPLLATWQRGLGRTAVWTSDATARWSTGWVGWDGYSGFWGAVVNDVLPPGRETPPEVRVEGGRLTIRVESGDAGVDASASARIRHPNGTVEIVPLRRTGGDVFEGEVDAAASGAYWVAATVEDGSVTSTAAAGAVSSYQQEFAFADPDPTLGQDIATTTGGRVDPLPAAAFDLAETIGAGERAIWPWLVAVALAAFLADVALRRLVVGVGDMEEWRAGVENRRRRERLRVEQVVERRQEEPDARAETASDSETLQRLIRRKHR